MLQQPALASQINIIEELRKAEIQGINILFELYDMLKATPELSSAAILERWRDHEMGGFLNKLLHWEIPGINDEKTALIMLQHAIENMQEKSKNLKLEALLHKSVHVALDAEEMSELQKLMQRSQNSPEQ